MKIGVAVVAHSDYIDRLAHEMSEKAINSLQQAGVEVVLCENKALVSQQEAISCSVYFLGSDVDGVILFLSTWIDCSVAMTVVHEVHNLPLLLWGFPMVDVGGMKQSTGSYVSFAMFKGVMDRIGKKYSRLLGLPGENTSTEAALRFCRAASLIKKLHRSRLGLIGYSAMSIYTGTFDHVLLRTMIGPEVIHLDAYSIITRAQSMQSERILSQEQWLKSMSDIADDVTDENIETAASITLSLMDFCHELDLDGINVKCQYEFSKEFGAVACVPVSSLADQGIVSSCEGDMLCTVSMLLLNRLTGCSVSYGDSINHTDNVLTLSACGFIPYSFADRDHRLIRKFAPFPGFKGIQNSFVARPGKMTMLRIIEDIGSYHILVFTGDALPESQLRQGYMPSVDIRLDGSMDKLVNHYNGQHYAYVYGDWSQDILEYCKLAGLPVIQV